MDDLLGDVEEFSWDTPEVLLEERGVLVLNKPAGLLTQAPPGIDSLEALTRRWLKVRESKSGKIYLAVTHRLDRPVSGAIVLAKNVRAANRIQDQFRKRTVEKVYFAAVHGDVPGTQGRLTNWMRKIPDQAKSEIVDEKHPDAKQAILHWEKLAETEQISLLKINLETGRTHQIRLQLSHAGHSILGDQLYGSDSVFGEAFPDLRRRAIALHARSIQFIHPILQEVVQIEAAFPENWRSLPFNIPG